ncbi:MAG: response regulator [Thermoanaerobaculia bacterium]
MKKTILLADDSVTIQKVVELTFMDEEFEVSSVNNGAEAIARLGEATPHVVIADVHMPGADGYEVCRRSKELHPKVPVLLLVGTFESFDAEAAERCGADGHLKKPFDSQDLLRRVRDLAASGQVAVPQPEPAQAAASAVEDEWEPIQEDAEETVFLGATPAAAPPEPPSFRFEPEDPAPARSVPAPPPARPMATMAPAATAAATSGPLSDADVDRIARRVIDLLGDKPVRDVAWEVVPDLAEVLLKSRIRELESSVE